MFGFTKAQNKVNNSKLTSLQPELKGKCNVYKTEFEMKYFVKPWIRCNFDQNLIKSEKVIEI